MRALSFLMIRGGGVDDGRKKSRNGSEHYGMSSGVGPPSARAVIGKGSGADRRTTGERCQGGVGKRDRATAR